VGRRELLAATMEYAYTRLRDRLEGVDDEEFFWKPVPDAWTIYEERPGHWTYHYEIPDPHPAPMTTIAWQVVHLGTTRLMYHEHAYGAAKLTFPEIPIPHTASTAMRLLEEGYVALRADLELEAEDGLDVGRKTPWGEIWPAWRIFTTMTDHDALHTGAIGNLRDLYYWATRS
jgi:DinB family protein